MDVVGYISVYHNSYHTVVDTLWSGTLRLFTQLDDSRGKLGSHNTNFKDSKRCLEYSDLSSLLNFCGHLTVKDTMFSLEIWNIFQLMQCAERSFGRFLLGILISHVMSVCGVISQWSLMTRDGFLKGHWGSEIIDLRLVIFGLGIVPLPTIFGVDKIDGLFWFFSRNRCVRWHRWSDAGKR